jgi:hypothetical protein
MATERDTILSGSNPCQIITQIISLMMEAGKFFETLSFCPELKRPFTREDFRDYNNMLAADSILRCAVGKA